MSDFIEIRLRPSFRYLHEPLVTPKQHADNPLIGRDTALRELSSRIVRSDGGAFLISGYRGVGKTSFTSRVVEAIQDLLSATGSDVVSYEVVDVMLTIARPLSTVELMFHILRGIYTRLTELDLLNCLPDELRALLELAFLRTSFQVSYQSGENKEHQLSISDLGGSIDAVGMAPKVGVSSKTTRSTSRALSFLAYDDKAAEYDLIRITRKLTDCVFRRPRWHRFPWTGHQVRLKLLIILDELDKLEEEPRGEPSETLGTLLRQLKNLFTTSGTCFLFVAGKDAYDRWTEDIGRGDSIYESIFGFAKYLPVLWEDVDQFCDRWLQEPELESADGVTSQVYDDFKHYLSYWGRGIPRRINRLFNNHVMWHDQQPCLRFTRADLRRFRFYAQLQEHLHVNEERLPFTHHLASAPERFDQRWLSLLYITDWILRQGVDQFVAGDVLGAARSLSWRIAPSERVAVSIVDTLLELLVEHEYLEASEAKAGDAVQYGPVPRDAVVSYRLRPRRLVEMGVTPEELDEARASRPVPAEGGIPGDRYEVLATIGHGGMGRVYKAFDRTTGRDVAIKELDDKLVENTEFVNRFRHEAAVLAQIDHPAIVKMYDADFEATPPYMVMELLSGVVLSDVLGDAGLPENVILAIAHPLLSALGYLHAHGIIWRDLKPSNVILLPDGSIRLIDFGIATGEKFGSVLTNPDVTQVGYYIGTPNYMAPEQIRGDRLDARTDLYAAGVLFFRMATGRLPFMTDNPFEQMQQHLNETPPAPSAISENKISDKFEESIMKCLEKDPADRFQSVDELLGCCSSEAAEPVSLVEIVANAEKADRTEEILETDWQTRVMPVAAQPAADVTGFPPPSFTEPPMDETTNMSPRQPGWLDLNVPGEAPRQFPLGGTRYSIGRSPDSDIVLQSTGVSRFHASLEKQAGGEYIVRDLNSSNGILINGKVVMGSAARIHDGYRLEIGDVAIEYHT